MCEESDFIQISALQHFLFCRRQCALSYIEQIWSDNLLTAEGVIIHNRAHADGFEARGGIRIERGMLLRSERFGLNGKADVVEFYKNESGRWTPFPVEYKHGQHKENDCDRVQLCAQAICLEEAMNVAIISGAIFYGKTRRRKEVIFDKSLRLKTEETVTHVRDFIKCGKTPAPQYSKRCESCSLIKLCMPKSIERCADVDSYIKRAIKASEI